MPDGTPVYDAYLAEAGGSGTNLMYLDEAGGGRTNLMAGLNQCAAELNPLPEDDPQQQIPGRGVPFLIVHSEWDFPLSDWPPLNFRPSRRRPNADAATDKFMMWEVAGASHGWTWQYDYSDAAPEDVVAAGFEPSGFVCGSDQPEINLYMVEKAAYVALDRWVASGIAPPSADYLETAAGIPGPVRDQHGNAVGGVRLPEIAVPLATYTGLYVPGPDCTDAVLPFDQGRVDTLYPEPGDYLGKFETAAQALVRDGFLLQEDALRLIEAAEQREQARWR